jgi:hypothetical protein
VTAPAAPRAQPAAPSPEWVEYNLCARSFAFFLTFYHFKDREHGTVVSYRPPGTPCPSGDASCICSGVGPWQGQAELVDVLRRNEWVFALKAGKLGFTELECGVGETVSADDPHPLSPGPLPSLQPPRRRGRAGLAPPREVRPMRADVRPRNLTASVATFTYCMRLPGFGVRRMALGSARMSAVNVHTQVSDDRSKDSTYTEQQDMAQPSVMVDCDRLVGLWKVRHRPASK